MAVKYARTHWEKRLLRHLHHEFLHRNVASIGPRATCLSFTTRSTFERVDWGAVSEPANAIYEQELDNVDPALDEKVDVGDYRVDDVGGLTDEIVMEVGDELASEGDRKLENLNGFTWSLLVLALSLVASLSHGEQVLGGNLGSILGFTLSHELLPELLWAKLNPLLHNMLLVVDYGKRANRIVPQEAGDVVGKERVNPRGVTHGLDGEVREEEGPVEGGRGDGQQQRNRLHAVSGQGDEGRVGEGLGDGECGCDEELERQHARHC